MSERASAGHPAEAQLVRSVLDALPGEADPAGRLGFTVADLARDAGWEAALEGVDHVLHVASPLGLSAGADPGVMISAARDGEFVWMREMAGVLRDGLGYDGRRVPTRRIPDAVVRFMARFREPALRKITPAPGRRNRHSTEEARTLLGRQPRGATPARCSAVLSELPSCPWARSDPRICRIRG
ncbi:hypothetical protein [Streptomyces sp. NPDC059861]|uniref:hypothetical protein n=1 Tax=Streptomyces sp. NPDC059861 TaxID=3346974 RepID=UPI0036685881